MKLLIKTNIVIGIFISIFILVNNIKDGYGLYFLVPLIFSFYNIFDLKNNLIQRINNNPGYAIFFITASIRYIYLPLIANLSNYRVFLGMTPNAKEYNQAIILIIYEEIMILLFSNILKRKYYKETNNISNIKLIKKHLLYFLMIFLMIIIVLFEPRSVSDINFISNLNKIDLTKTIILDFPLAGLFKLIIEFGRLIIVLLIIEYCYKKNKKNKRKLYILIPIFAVIVNSLFVINLSRFGMIVPIISFGFLLLKLYKRQEIEIKNIMVSCIIIIVVMMSTIKFFGEGRNNDNNSAEDINYWGETVQTYFMGVKECAVGIHAENLIEGVYGENKYLLIFNDIFSNVVGLSNFTVPTLSTVFLYNYVYFPGVDSVSQIPPNIINGYYYFGTYLSPLYSLFFVWIFSFLDMKSRNANGYVEKFSFIYGAVYSSLFMMINGAMIICYLCNVSLLLFIYSKLSNKIT